MNKIHKLSSVAALPELDIFAVPPTQIAIEKSIETEHRPTSALNSSSFIEFAIQTSSDEFILFYETYLHLTAKVKINNATVTEANWKSIVPAKNLMHSMIKMCQISIGNKEITRSPQSYAYRAYIENLLAFEKSSKDTLLSSVVWEPNADFYSSIYPSTFTEKESKEFELYGKLHTDLTFQNKALLGGSNITIRLLFNAPEFVFQADESLKLEIVITDASLFLHRFKASQALLTAHHKALSIAPAKYPITRVEIKEANISKGSLDATLENIVLGQLPRRMLVVLVKNTAFNGSIKNNPFKFEHFKLNYIASYIDGVQYPARAYQPNFDKNKFLREYNGLFQALNQNNTSTSIDITRKMYGDGNTIFAFNFSPDLSNGHDAYGHVSEIKRGSLRLQIKFASELTEAINVLMFCEFDNIIEINRDREVFTDYN